MAVHNSLEAGLFEVAVDEDNAKNAALEEKLRKIVSARGFLERVPACPDSLCKHFNINVNASSTSGTSFSVS